MSQIHAPDRFDNPTDVGELAEQFVQARPTVRESTRNADSQPFINARVHVSAADKTLRSGITSDRKQAALSKARTYLLRAVEVIDQAKAELNETTED